MSDGEGTVAGADDAAADDALLVLTAMLLTPSRFPGVLGDDYVAACEALALEPYEEGYGLILGQDGAGARWTVVVEETSQVAVAIAAWDCGMEHDLSPDERSMVCALPGWPMDLAVAAPGVPDPHDPDTDGRARHHSPRPTRRPGVQHSAGSAPTRSPRSGRRGASRSTTRSSPCPAPPGSRTVTPRARWRTTPERMRATTPEGIRKTTLPLSPAPRCPQGPVGGDRLHEDSAASRADPLLLRLGRRTYPARRRPGLVDGGSDRRHRPVPAGRGAGHGHSRRPRNLAARPAHGPGRAGRPGPVTSRPPVHDETDALGQRPISLRLILRSLLRWEGVQQQIARHGDADHDQQCPPESDQGPQDGCREHAPDSDLRTIRHGPRLLRGRRRSCCVNASAPPYVPRLPGSPAPRTIAAAHRHRACAPAPDGRTRSVRSPCTACRCRRSAP